MLLSPLGGLRHCRHLLFTAGSGGLRTLRDGVWQDDDSPAAPAWSAATTLPSALSTLRRRVLDTAPGDVLTLGTGATLRLFAHPATTDALAAAWYPAVPGLHRYLHDTVTAVPGDATAH
ncbi:hypothetical protein AB0D62_01380 [Streptomyces massasporeus]|uniref:hypothetical protein n=1 Tax=Streptomyces massasporeus TaxID=67324 RepID=UPI0034093F05